MDSNQKREWFFDVELGELLRKDEMPYLLVDVIAKRAKQLMMGERALARPANGSERRVDIATAEIYEGKLRIEPRRKKVVEKQQKLVKL